jgi:hypothetical protein
LAKGRPKDANYLPLQPSYARTINKCDLFTVTAEVPSFNQYFEITQQTTASSFKNSITSLSQGRDCNAGNVGLHWGAQRLCIKIA